MTLISNDDLVEQVARAIHDTDDLTDTVWPESDDDNGFRGDGAWVRICQEPEVFRRAARAALAIAAPAIVAQCQFKLRTRSSRHKRRAEHLAAGHPHKATRKHGVADAIAAAADALSDVSAPDRWT